MAKRTRVKSAEKSENTMPKHFCTDRSFLTYKDNNLLVLTTITGRLDISPTAVKICNGFYMEFGRPLEQYKYLLSKINIHIIFERVSKNGNLELYNIVMLKTKDTEDTVLANLTVNNGVITSLSRTLDSKSKEMIDKFVDLGSIWKVSLAKSNNIEDTKKRALNTVRVMTKRLDDHEFNVKYQINQIIVKVTGQLVNYEYMFYLNEATWRYELLLIKFINT